MTGLSLEPDNHCILIVDDSPVALHSKSRLLRQQGYHVVEAKNGGEALAMITAERPDLIVLDINLPDISGFDICRELKARAETQLIKVLQTSAVRIGPLDRLRGLEVGADAYVFEPAEDEEFIGTVKALLKLAQQEQNNQRLIESLKESDARYRSLIDRMPAAMYTIDRDGHITFYNEQAAELWGWRPRLGDSEVRFCGSHKLFRSDGTPLGHDQTPMAHAARDGTITHGQEITIERLDGTRRHLIAHADPLRNAEGHVIGAVNLLTDITASKQAEEAMRCSEARFRTLASAVPIGIFRTDAAGCCVYVNEWWQRIAGMEAAEAYGSGWMTRLHCDDREKVFNAWKGALVHHQPFAAEYRFVNPSGRETWVLGHAVPEADGGYVGITLDITARKQAEAELRESEARLQAVMDRAPAAIFMKDRDGRSLFMNEECARVLGLDRTQVQGKTEYELYPPELAEQFRMNDQVVWTTGEGQVLEEHVPQSDGLHTYASNKFLLHDLDGVPYALCGIASDITPRRRMEEALRETQARLQSWNAELERAVNHKTAELQQSQNRLRAMATELNLTEQRERKRLATDLHDHLQQMLVVGKITIRQGKQVSSNVPAFDTVLDKVDNILSTALTYSRTLVAELSPPVLRSHGLAASLEWLAEYMKDKHELTVTVVVPDDQDMKMPDDEVVLLFQSVRELLINSAKHAGTGQATLTMELHTDDLCLTVQDDGKGFDCTAAGGMSHLGVSSTFGLISIEERMRALGGSFTLDSAPGQGTTARLVLPLTQRTEAYQVHRGALDAVTARGSAGVEDRRTKRSMIVSVLLVDDHAMVRQGLRAMLDAYADIQVVGEAWDGVEAVKLHEKLRPQVVVMDINMPTMNGIEATEHIKQGHPETIVIGISVNIGNDNCDAMQRVGATTVLTKEAAVEQLYDTIVGAFAS